jgi:hypothetical protein
MKVKLSAMIWLLVVINVANAGWASFQYFETGLPADLCSALITTSVAVWIYWLGRREARLERQRKMWNTHRPPRPTTGQFAQGISLQKLIRLLHERS